MGFLNRFPALGDAKKICPEYNRRLPESAASLSRQLREVRTAPFVISETCCCTAPPWTGGAIARGHGYRGARCVGVWDCVGSIGPSLWKPSPACWDIKSLGQMRLGTSGWLPLQCLIRCSDKSLPLGLSNFRLICRAKASQSDTPCLAHTHMLIFKKPLCSWKEFQVRSPECQPPWAKCPTGAHNGTGKSPRTHRWGKEFQKTE